MNAKKLLWQSVDVKRRKNRVFCLAPVWVLLLFFSFIIALASMAGGVIVFGGLLALGRRVCAAIAIYDLYKIWDVVSRHKRVIFCECTLVEFGCANGHYFFKVDIPTAEGTYHTCTRPIYSDTSIHAGFNDWKNKRVIVAYDPQESIAFVIGEATEELRRQLVIFERRNRQG